MGNKIPKADLTGLTIGSVTVDKYLGNSIWECTCKCSKKIKVKTFNLTQALKNNRDYTCEECSYNKKHIDYDITGQIINNWTILEYVGSGKYRCRCKCGVEQEVLGKTIKNGTSKSCRKCGAQDMVQTRLSVYKDTTYNALVNRTDEQLRAVKNADSLKEFIEQKFSYKPKVKELAILLGITEVMVLRKIHKFRLEEYVDIIESSSSIENNVADYIISLCSCTNYTVERHNKTLLNGQELDIYIPDIKLAIEVNGNYWHSTAIQDKYYHRNKSIQCGKIGIQLIHIFEYEWNNDNTRDKIKALLKSKICSCEKVIYARKCSIKQISASEYTDFLIKHHLHNSANASIKLGCYYNNVLLGILGIGKSRFTSEYEYEVIRSCWTPSIAVVGGAEKIFNYFIKNYNPSSIITYVDLSKFIGLSYLRLGFKPISNNTFSEPNYIWIKPSKDGDDIIMTRYQTQKHKLLKYGMGIEEQTEDEIMETWGYYKIYDSGNIRLEWRA